ncbi:hypothetical protein Tfer_0493 [Thermincola ferriacetica]|uniref:Uncharacterized protein n=2 Tax=Thermincola TaxID=278993 RepID=D5X7A3_THEPJ|nr:MULTISPECIES: hypothetical protein [Thermincola]ADG82473.1 conserved hypothetical protein [Thermincola potens JR]KNZ70814.1 hypothetical protein Tfer_0493 [Thermincola ferriacetica]
MVNTIIGNEIQKSILKAKIRLDYKGITKPAKFLFGGKSTDQAAEEMRDQQVALLRNVPLQGIKVEDVDMSLDVYTVYDEIQNTHVAYAPVVLTVVADSLEDIVRFVARDEFRKIEILEPDNMVLSRMDTERILFRLSEEMRTYRMQLERRLSTR